MHGLRLVALVVSWLGACAHAPAPVVEAKESKPAGRCKAEVTPTSEGEHGVSGALTRLNVEARGAHQAARARACGELGGDRLVIRYSFGSLEARWKGQALTPEGLHVIPAAYHPLKDVGHGVLLASLLFGEPPGPERGRRAAAAIAAIDAVRAELGDPSSAASKLIPAEHLPRQRRLLEKTRTALAAFAAGELGEDGQRRYFADVRGDVEETLRTVAGALLRNLDREVQAIRKKVQAEDPRAWDSMLVIVATVHQPRAREIGLQYFERLLNEPVGEGARNERRLVVSENLFSGADQYGLLALHVVDQAVSTSIFGDPLRMQWDALGDHGGVLDALLPPAR